MALTIELRKALLQKLEFDRGHAGDTSTIDSRSFYPVEDHLRALDPNIIFVVGARGAGKSKLVEAIADERLRPSLARRARVTLPKDGGTWLKGFPYGDLGPSHRAWERFVLTGDTRLGRLQVLWLGLLVRTLAATMTDDDRVALAPILGAVSTDAAALHAATEALVEQVERRLDALDARLRETDRHVFVMYDELDTLYYEDWQAMMRCRGGLTALWAGYHRRWSRIQPKFFMRTDLFAEQSSLMSSDAVKMAARRVELHWSSRQLYGALFKHIIHRDPALFEYFAPSLHLQESKVFGAVPGFERDGDEVSAVHRLCGEWMGANSNKGYTHRWLIGAVSDGLGEASPRNLIQLVEGAAINERQDPRPVNRATQLLHHISLRNALTDVSTAHVQTAIQSEQPWLFGVRERLEKPRTREVPWARRAEVVQYLSVDWDASWSAGPDRPRPPASTSEELVDRLLRLGVFRERGVDSIDVPDLYLEGLHLKRRGGVARE